MNQKFQVLCVTMNQTDFSKIAEMNIQSDVVFANQCERTAYEEIEFNGHTAKMISTETRGVGKNRNLALMYASAEICLFADDDVKYVDSAKEKILLEFEKYPNADVIIFNLESTDNDRQLIKHTKTKHWKSIRNPWGACRIAFRLKSIIKNSLWFSTLFGGGCVFPAGEDSIWLKQARRKGLKFYVSKEIIGKVSFATSTWFTGYDEKYYYGIGACYAALYGHVSLIRKLYSTYITRKKGDLSFVEKIKWIKAGAKGYKKLQSFEECIGKDLNDC